MTRFSALAVFVVMSVAPSATASTVPAIPGSSAWQRSGALVPGFAANPADAVHSLFRDHADFFGLRPEFDAFGSVQSREHFGIQHLRMTQTYRGIPVRGGQYMVSVRNDGLLRLMAGRSVPDVEVEIDASFPASEAIATAERSLGRGPGLDRSTTSLAIERAGDRDHLVWQVTLDGSGAGEGWEVLVDAHDGAIVGSRSRAFGASGCAAVWQPSPLVPLQEDDFAITDPSPGASARLEGVNVRVLHETAPAPVTSTFTNGCFDFHFDPVTQPESFDQVNVYWNVDHYIREFLGGIGFAGLPAPLTVILKPFRCGESATGETIDRTIWLTSEGCGYRSSTRDGDIIAHEAQHAINNFFGLEGGTDLDREIYATALHESFANYFSCAAHDDPIYAEYFFGPQGFANCNSDPAEYNYSRRYELGVGQLQNYTVGMIWSGALWDIRRRIGPVIDQIALESLYYLPAAPSFHNAVDAILQVDRDFHGGAHQTEMIAAFAGRGLGPGLPEVSILGPSQVEIGQAATWTASVCCGPGPWTYRWTRIPDLSTNEELVGIDSSVTFVPAGSCRLRLLVADAEGHQVLKSFHVSSVGLAALRVEIEGPTQIVGRVISTWTARVSGQGSYPVGYRWIYGTASVSDSMSCRLSMSPGNRTLRVIVYVPGTSASATLSVTVIDAPVAEIHPNQNPLPPGQATTLWGSVFGGNAPYTWRWSRNGTAAENLIANTQSVQVTGDSIETDYYLVATAAGKSSLPVRITISPAGVPLVVGIDGPEQIRRGSPGTWYAVMPGGTPPTVDYRWTRICNDAGCEPEVLGFGPSLTYQPARGFELELSVAAGLRTASSRRQVHVRSVPFAPAAKPRSNDTRGVRPPTFTPKRTMVRNGETLAFGLEGPEGSSANIDLLDIAGRSVASLYAGPLGRGIESIEWRSAGLSSGVYLVRARIAGQSFVHRIVVVQ